MFINLILPPIVIVVAIALLIMFLARVVPKSEDEARKRQLKKQDNSKSDKKDDDEEIVISQDVEEELELQDVSNDQKEELKEEFEKKGDDSNGVGLNYFPTKSATVGSKFKKKTKKKKKNGAKSFFSKFNFFKRRASKGSVVLPGINRVDGIKRVNSTVNFTQNNEESLSRMDKILLDSRNLSKNSNSSNKEESELVRQISVDPRNPESYRRLGDFYVESDRLTDARECYKYVLRLDPRHKRAQLAMKRLDRILG